jgi:hypothetical protein
MEDRLTPTTGIPWLDPGSLTLSFVPDGTDVSGSPSSLYALLGASQTAAWKREILRAFQTWAAQADLNIGVVPDGGQPMGAPGATQGDPRFGDIRIGARPLSAQDDGGIASATGFEPGGGTWAGDLLFNNADQFAVGNPTGQQYDLYNVVLHEAGHSFGLKHNETDSTAVMWPNYQLHNGLTPPDVAAIQGLYGPRLDDAYEGPGGNGTFATAYDLSQNGQLTSFSADVTRPGDVDVYKFTTPDATSGATALTVNLRATGISLLTARVTVYDANQNPVGTAVTTDPLSNDLSIPIANYQPSSTYYVRVEGAGTDVFSVGAYVLRLDYNVPVGTSNIKLGTPSIDYETGANETFDTAAPLTQLPSLNTPSFAVEGSLAAGDTDWYKITPQWSSAGTGTLTAAVWPGTPGGVLPVVRVYDAQGVLLGADVVANDHGTFAVQVPNQQAGQTYYIQVQAANPGGARSTGSYVLGANLSPYGPIRFQGLAGSTLSASQSVVSSKMDVKDVRLTQFTLSADIGASTADAAVRMTIFDDKGHAVFTMVAFAGQPLVTGNVWLAPGSYTVVFNAATRSGAPLPNLAFNWSKRERSSPLDPIFLDPTGDPTQPIVTTTPPTNDPIGISLIDPISNPFSVV